MTFFSKLISSYWQFRIATVSVMSVVLLANISLRSYASEATERMEIEDLIEAHESNSQLIRFLDVEIETWHKSLYGPDADKPKYITGLWRWSVDSDQDLERFKSKSFTNAPASLSVINDENTVFQDIFHRTGERMVLIGLNPNSPPKITLLDQSGISAYVESNTGFYPTSVGECASMLLREVRSVQSRLDSRKDLRSLFNSSKEVKRLINTSEELANLVGIRFTQNPLNEDGYSASIYDVYLNPQAGFMIERMVLQGF